ncbi:MAG: glycosyltransferase [Bacteroidota bacterium]
MANKKVLILAYDFPPYNSIAAQRPASWARYLPKFGIDTTVVTLHWDNEIRDDQSYIIPSFKKTVLKDNLYYAQVFRVPFSPNLRDKLLFNYGFNRYVLLRKTLSIFYFVLKYFWLKADNTRQIYKHADVLLKNEHFDILLVTAEPFILFKYANILSRKHKIPWVADYRDAWTNNPALEMSVGLMSRLNEWVLKPLEKKYISSTSLITTPSPSSKKLIQRLFPDKPISVVYNGHDIKNIKELNSIPQSNKQFTIAYAGRVYAHQDLEVFLEGYRLFLEGYEFNVDTEVIFYGLNFYHDNVQRVLSFDKTLNRYIKITDRLPYPALTRNLCRANLFLLLSTKNARWLNAKIFDYLPLQRKIILVRDDHGILHSILEECQAGHAVASASELAVLLKRCYESFVTDGRVKHITIGYEKYSRATQAEFLAKLLTQCVE